MSVDQCHTRIFRILECCMNINGAGFCRFLWSIPPACGDAQCLTITFDHGRDDRLSIVASAQDADGHVCLLEQINRDCANATFTDSFRAAAVTSRTGATPAQIASLSSPVPPMTIDEIRQLRVADAANDRRLMAEQWRHLCSYCSREHDSRMACPEYAYGLLRPGETRMTIIGRGGALPALEPMDHADGLPDDAQLPLEAFNAKIDAVLADVARWQKKAEETHGNTDHSAE